MNTIPKPATRYRLAALLILFPFLVSCAHLPGPDYCAQLITGEVHILTSRVSIRAVLDDKQAPEELKKNLRSVLEMREFAVQELGLPETGSFTFYADTGRKFASWVLTATPEFSTAPQLWCLPFDGCSSHLTFFDEQIAKRYEKKLTQQGYDVSFRGTTAYSTGGYFSDPVLNTLFEYPDYDYASSIFHEISHEKLRIKSESNFSESFAVFVGRTGQYAWVKKHYGDELAEKITADTRRSVGFANLIAATWRNLNALYEKKLAPEETRVLKREIFQKMKKEYAALKESWGGYDGYDGWFKKTLNNARIAETNDYGNLVPLFEKLFEFSGRDLRNFYQQAEALAKLSPLERKREIQNILKDEAVQ